MTSVFERDVVFLDFGDDELTTKFLDLIEGYKIELSSSILWYLYLNGIGAELIVEETNQPLTFSGFSRKMYQDAELRAYYDQLFQYLYKVSERKYEQQITDVLPLHDLGSITIITRLYPTDNG